MTVQGAALLTRLETLLPAVREAGTAMDSDRGLSDAVMQQMKDAGLFRMTMPKDWGGLELDPIEQTQALEMLAQADGATAWTVMIGSDAGYIVGYLPQGPAHEMFTDIDAPAVMVVAPVGMARVVEGGYIVNGRWSFASGSRHAPIFSFGCHVVTDKGPRRGADGKPEMRLVVMRRADVTVEDTWYTLGLRATGSNHVSVKDVFVPEAMTCDLVDPEPVHDSPMFKHWSLWNANMAGVPLGMAREAIAVVRDRSVKKRTPTGSRVSDEVYMRQTLALATAKLESTRAYYYQALEDLWSACLAGQKPSLEQRAHWRLALAYTFDTCFDVVSSLYKVSGASALYHGDPLERIMRNMTAANQHINASPRSYELAGQMLFGDDPHAMYF